jgi:hypothetical protein
MYSHSRMTRRLSTGSATCAPIGITSSTILNDSTTLSPVDHGSMAAEQASVGAAAMYPTTGTILIPADATRHGAAARPQPLRARHRTKHAALVNVLIRLPHGETTSLRASRIHLFQVPSSDQPITRADGKTQAESKDYIETVCTVCMIARIPSGCARGAKVLNAVSYRRGKVLATPSKH